MMKKFMLVGVDEDGNQFAWFYDDLDKAESARMDASVSCGWYVEVYERVTEYDDNGIVPLFDRYEFIYS